jgi:hypothetical protein
MVTSAITDDGTFLNSIPSSHSQLSCGAQLLSPLPQISPQELQIPLVSYKEHLNSVLPQIIHKLICLSVNIY